MHVASSLPDRNIMVHSDPMLVSYWSGLRLFSYKKTKVHKLHLQLRTVGTTSNQGQLGQLATKDRWDSSQPRTGGTTRNQGQLDQPATSESWNNSRPRTVGTTRNQGQLGQLVTKDIWATKDSWNNSQPRTVGTTRKQGQLRREE